MKTYTVDDVMSCGLGHLYTQERTIELFAGRSTLTAAEILQTDMPFYQRLLTLRALKAGTSDQWARWARMCADRVAHLRVNWAAAVAAGSSAARSERAARLAKHALEAVETSEWETEVAAAISRAEVERKWAVVEAMTAADQAVTAVRWDVEVYGTEKTEDECSWQKEQLIKILQEEGL
jgi:hypothetical protein